MTKFYSVLAGGLLSVLALGSLPVAGQTQPLPVPRRTCATEDINAQIQAELKRTIPGYNPARVAAAKASHTARTGAVTYTLPVIVHVINNGEAIGTGANISQAQVQSQLDVLNEDYRNTNADGTLTPAVYQPRRGDMQVQFVNALRDPNGNTLAEPGIDRVNRNTKGWTAPPYASTAYINSTIKPGSSWDPSRYVNIWVMNLGGGLLGYAQFPDNTAGLGGLSTLGGSAATDGVVILYTAYGSRTKAPGGTYDPTYNLGRTLTHELGHWFGFRHITGDAACGNDYCADTPPQQALNFGCVAFPHITCSNVTGDMSMNYMDYSDDRCMYMFTQDQKDRLQAVMVNTPRRAELANSNVACPTIVATTAANSGAACAGGTLSLTATGPAGATYAWTGPNGYTSTAQNPTLTNVTVAAAGTYKVTVSVTTGACPGVATTTAVVNSAPAVPVLAPAITCPGSPVTLSATGLTPPTGTFPNENFNGTAPGWVIASTGSTGTSWQYSAGYTYSSTYLSLSNYTLDGTRFAIANSDAGGGGSNTNTTLTSPVFSTVGYSALQVSFLHRMYYVSGDVPTVEVSIDGGTTWAVATTYTAAQGTATAPVTATVNLTPFVGQPNVRVRWHYVSSWEYYWAIDNVQFTGTTPTYTYAWTLVSGDGLPTATNAPTLVATPTQSSVYRLTVGFVGGTCTSASTVNVNVYPTPTLVSSLATACPGSPATLSATNLAGFSPTYAWTLVSGDGLPATTNAATLSVTPTQNSVYRLTVTYPGSCSLSSTVSVAAVPTPALVASASVICAGSTSQLSATNVPATGYTYAWTLVSGNGLPATVNTPTLTVSPTQSSVYRLTVSNGSCSASSTVNVVGVTNTIDAYPVPFGDAGLSLQVSTCTAGAASVQIYDIMGRRVYDNTVGAPAVGITTISLPETGRLQPGKYIVKVQQGTQNTTFNVVRQ